MAESHLSFRIGSVFSAEGFKQATATAKKMSGDVKQAASHASQLAGALGGMDAAASKSLQAMTGMVQAILTFNVASIATQAAIVAINFVMDKMATKAENARRRAEELKVAAHAAFSSSLRKSVAEVNDEIKSMTSEFDRITAQAKAFTAAVNGLRGSVATGGIVNLEIEKVNAMLEAHSEAERLDIEATYNLMISKEKSKAVEQEWSDKVAVAHQDYVRNEELVTDFNRRIAALQQKRAELEASANVAKASDVSKWKEIQAEIEKLSKQEADLLVQQSEARQKSIILSLAEDKARQDAINAQSESTIAVTEAELAQKRLAEKVKERADKEMEAAAAAMEKAAADWEAKQRIDVEKEAAEIQRSVNEASRDLATAEREYAEALRDYEKNFADNKMWESFNDAVNKGLSGLNLGSGDLSKEMTEQAIKDAIANGEVRTVKELDRFAREAQRSARDKISGAKAQFGREKMRYEQLKRHSRKTWSKQDADFFEKFSELEKAATAQRKSLDEKKQRAEEARRRSEEVARDLKEIKEKLEELGLK